MAGDGDAIINPPCIPKEMGDFLKSPGNPGPVVAGDFKTQNIRGLRGWEYFYSRVSPL